MQVKKDIEDLKRRSARRYCGTSWGSLELYLDKSSTSASGAAAVLPSEPAAAPPGLEDQEDGWQLANHESGAQFPRSKTKGTAS